MLLPEYREILEAKVKQFGSQGWEEVFNRVVSASRDSAIIPKRISYERLLRKKRWPNNAPTTSRISQAVY